MRKESIGKIAVRPSGPRGRKKEHNKKRASVGGGTGLQPERKRLDILHSTDSNSKKKEWRGWVEKKEEPREGIVWVITMKKGRNQRLGSQDCHKTVRGDRCRKKESKKRGLTSSGAPTRTHQTCQNKGRTSGSWRYALSREKKNVEDRTVKKKRIHSRAAQGGGEERGGEERSQQAKALAPTGKKKRGV